MLARAVSHAGSAWNVSGLFSVQGHLVPVGLVSTVRATPERYHLYMCYTFPSSLFMYTIYKV